MDKVSLKEDGSNFNDWESILRSAAISDGKLRYLVDPSPPEPGARAAATVRASYDEYERESNALKNVLIYSMAPSLQRRLIGLNAHEIFSRLSTMFSQAPRILKYEAAAKFFDAKLGKGQSVSSHVLKMIEYVETMERLGNKISKELAVDRVLHSLGDSYSFFRVNYNMNNMDKTLHELHSLLVQSEKDMKVGGSSTVRGDVLTVTNKKGKFKKSGKKPVPPQKGKGKTPVAKGPKSGVSPKPKKKGATPEEACFYCNQSGHWKRNCPKYLEDKAAGRVTEGELSSNVYVIEINTTNQNVWILDTGCGSHLCNHVQGLRNARPLARGEVDLRVGNGARVAAVSVGTFVISLPSGLDLYLNKCYYVPQLTKNIISVSVLDSEGFCILIKNQTLTFSFDDLVYGQATSNGGIYILDSNTEINHITNKKLKKGDPKLSYLWHCRLGHINENRVKRLVSTSILPPFDFESYGVCESCLLGKMTRSPFLGKGTRASDLLGLIHTDVCGPMSITARGGFNYFITFTDDLSRYGFVYLMKHKSEAFEKFKEFQNEVENQLDRKIKALRSDRGGEYLSYDFDDHLKSCGIVSQLTPPGTPQLNGVSERRNRTLLDMVRSMMGQVELPNSFWGFALLSATFLLNRSPTKAANKSPYEIWKGSVPNMSFLKIWGCDAYVKVKVDDKLAPRSEKCIFVGYPKETRGYYFYNHHEGKVFVAREAVFLEQEFVSRRQSGRKFELDEVQEPQTETDQILEENVPSNSETIDVSSVPRRSGRVSRAPERYLGNIDQYSDSVLLLLESDEPKTYKAAVSSPNSKLWIDAMQSEMDSMYDN